MGLHLFSNILKKWWWLIIIATLVAATASYAISKGQPKVYQATTTVIVGKSIQTTESDYGDILISERLAKTYANIVRRQPVLQEVVNRLNLSDSWQELRERVTIKLVQDTELLEITVEAGSPLEAKETADEIANQLILQSPTAAENQEVNKRQHFASQRLDNIQTKIESGQKQLSELEAAISDAESIEQIQKLQAEINDLQKLISDWETNYTQLLIYVEGGRSPNYLAVIESAEINPVPVRPRVMINTILAGLMGFLVTLGIVFLTEHLDDTLKSTDDIGQLLGVTVLGAISRIKGKNPSEKLLLGQKLFSSEAEAYRMVRSNIQFMLVDQPTKLIVITSPASGEGKSTTVANLGVIMAQAGFRTIIVDADLRRSVQHELFQVPNQSGLTDLILLPNRKASDLLQNTQVENLQLITRGTLPPNPSELLGSRRMDEVLSELAGLGDVVLLDSPPAAIVTDAVVLSTKVSGVVMVVEADQTHAPAAKQAIANLQKVGANLFGVILNRISKQGETYYYQSYLSTDSVSHPSQTGKVAG